MNDVETALAEINELLGIDAIQTFKGDEIKFWAYDPEDNRRVKSYMTRSGIDRLIQNLMVVRDGMK